MPSCSTMKVKTTSTFLLSSSRAEVQGRGLWTGVQSNVMNSPGDRFTALRQHVDRLGGERVSILGVAKGFPFSAVEEVMRAGCSLIGENYAQEVIAKYAPIAIEQRPELHFIGRLQTNKISALAPYVACWQSVDRERVIDGLARHAPDSQILIQVNVTGELDKGGCDPAMVETLVERARDSGLRVRGLMTLGPTEGDEASIRAAFGRASRIRSDVGLEELSMGMSHDLDIAVEMGSTMVRVGTALFGSRAPKNWG